MKTLVALVVGGILGLVVGLAAPSYVNGVSESVKFAQSAVKKDCVIGDWGCDYFIGLVNPISVTLDDTICNNFKLPALDYTFTYTLPEHTYTIANPAPAPEVHLVVVGYAGLNPMIGYREERNQLNANLVTEIHQKGSLSKYVSPGLGAAVIVAEEPVCTRTFVGNAWYDSKNAYALMNQATSLPTIVGFHAGKRTVK